MVSKEDANLINADDILWLLMRDLDAANYAMAQPLPKHLREEIIKRRTICSAALEVLNNPRFDFDLEIQSGQRIPSDEEILHLCGKILDAVIEAHPRQIDVPVGVSRVL